MVEYLKYGKTAEKDYIKDLYEQMKGEIPDEVLKAPLREFTYERKRAFMNKEGQLFTPDRNLSLIIHNYVAKYKIKLDKDVTLEEAINKV